MEEELNKIFDDLEKNAYEPIHHKYWIKETKQIIRKHFEKLFSSQLGIANKNGKKAALDIMNEWNDFAGEHNLNRVLKLTDKRISNVKQRLTEIDFNIYHIFQRIEESDFLRGKNKEGWKVDFDFIFGSKNNWVKIMEGKYATNRSSGGATPEELRAIVQRRADREQAGSQSL